MPLVVVLLSCADELKDNDIYMAPSSKARSCSGVFRRTTRVLSQQGNKALLDFTILYGAIASGIPTLNAATEVLQHRSVAVGPQTVRFTSGRSDSPTVKPAIRTRGSIAAREPAGNSTGLFVEGPLPAGIHHLQCEPPCMPSRDLGSLC